jgi:hypothetical protein
VLASGANTVNASPASDNNAISASYGAQFRAFYGLLTVNGNSTVGDDSELNFRDVVYTGNISVGNKGGLRFTNRADQTLNEVTMIGNVTVNSLALVGISGLSPSSSGTVTCNSPATSCVFAFAPMTLVNC